MCLRELFQLLFYLDDTYSYDVAQSCNDKLFDASCNHIMSNVEKQNCRKPRMRDGFQMVSRDDDSDDLHYHEEEDLLYNLLYCVAEMQA